MDKVTQELTFTTYSNKLQNMMEFIDCNLSDFIESVHLHQMRDSMVVLKSRLDESLNNKNDLDLTESTLRLIFDTYNITLLSSHKDVHNAVSKNTTFESSTLLQLFSVYRLNSFKEMYVKYNMDLTNGFVPQMTTDADNTDHTKCPYGYTKSVLVTNAQSKCPYGYSKQASTNEVQSQCPYGYKQQMVTETGKCPYGFGQ